MLCGWGTEFWGVIYPSERLLQLYMYPPQVLYMFFQRLRSAEDIPHVDSPHTDSILMHVRVHTHTHTCTHAHTHMHTHTHAHTHTRTHTHTHAHMHMHTHIRTALDSPSAQFPKHLLTPRQER